MPDARLYIEEQIAPGLALERAAAMTRALDVACPVGMYGATLRGEAWVLGALQHAGQVLPDRELRAADASPVAVVRRGSGGIAVRGGQGVTYVALALRDRATLMPCPRARILNRNVRGALQGLRQGGIVAHYFGRDFLSVDARPAAYVGWAARSDGRVVLEFFLCEASSCFLPEGELGYPTRKTDPFRGKEPWTLAQATGNVLSSGGRPEPARGRALIECIAAGYRSGFGAAFEACAIPSSWETPELQRALPLDPDASELHWSHPIEEAIGFVSAGVALDRAAKLARVRMCGDFFADDTCAVTLERMLIGVEPTTDHIARAVDAAYGQAGHDVEGVRDLRTFQTAILDAVARARAVL